MNKYIVITSIFEPTEAVEKFAKLKDWKLIVVGDKKTPESWKYENVIYLSPEDQNNLGYEITNILPWNSYSRKIIGYLYALKNGAEVIADTDDDNIPYEGWGEDISFDGIYDTVDVKRFINIYKFYTKEHIWPRGYPLNKILEDHSSKTEKRDQKIGIWQHLADEDPDVDAIYRLTINKPVYFNKREKIVLEENTLCPFNSQNTFIRKELFPLLFLPAFVNFRYTDILRGFIAQILMWNEGYRLGFGNATVIQKRNPHDYLKDFESEIPCFLYPEKVVDWIKSVIDGKRSLSENLWRIYNKLHQEGVVSKEDVTLVSLWLKNF